MTRRPGPDGDFGITPLSDAERLQEVEAQKRLVIEIFGIALLAGDHPLIPAEANIACITLRHARENGVDTGFIEDAWIGIRAGSNLDGLTHEQALARLLQPQG